MATEEAEPVSFWKPRNILKYCIIVVTVLILAQIMQSLLFSLSNYSLENYIIIRRNMPIYENNVSSNGEASNLTFQESLQINSSSRTLQLCPEFPPNLSGTMKTYSKTPGFEVLEKLFLGIETGGRFRPKDCVSRHRVAIIIPYRDREEQLRTLLYNLHAMLTRQQLDYGIYVIEEALPTKFNRAMLLNIGYNEAIKIYDYQCFIFHDVDLIPQDDRLLYNCPTQPRHMSAAIDIFQYKLPYPNIFGGVSALTKEQFIKVNGFSNIYFGWGGEDDDMYERIIKNGYHISRYPMGIAKYKMAKHNRDKGNDNNPNRFSYLENASKRSEVEGLSTLKYKLLHLVGKKLYTWVHVQINETEVMKHLEES